MDPAEMKRWVLEQLSLLRDTFVRGDSLRTNDDEAEIKILKDMQEDGSPDDGRSKKPKVEYSMLDLEDKLPIEFYNGSGVIYLSYAPFYDFMNNLFRKIYE